MTTHSSASPRRNTTDLYTAKALNRAATVWFIVATLGLWFFGSYILLFYGKATSSGHPERWNRVLAKGYVASDWLGNLAVGVHVLLAAVLVVGGPLQLMPTVRRYVPVLHRWLGRAYVVTAVIASLTGVAMVWTRGAVGDTGQHISISVQAVYIVLFALLSIRYARRHQFEAHRKWVLRLFMVTNGVWFFRVGLMCWLLINGGPAGFDPQTFSGPFLTFLATFTYAVPLSLIVLELYFYAQRKQDRTLHIFTTILIAVCTLLMGIGIAGAVTGMWLPRL